MTITINPHASAVLALAASATMPDGAPIPIGDSVAPKSPDGRIVAPCAVFHLRPGGRLSGSIGQPNTDVLIRFQFTAIGTTAIEARGVADFITEAIDGQDVEVDGREVVRIGRPYGASPNLTPERDDDVTPPLFYVPVEFLIWTVPADGS